MARFQEVVKSAAIVLLEPIKWTPTQTLEDGQLPTSSGQDPSDLFGLYKAERLQSIAAQDGAGPDAGKIVSTANAGVVFPDAQAGQFVTAVLDYEVAEPD